MTTSTTLPATAAVGRPAPEFVLKDQNNEDFALRDHRGQRAVLLVFYPFAFTGICTDELGAVRDDPSTFCSASLVTASISCDSAFAHKIFAEREGFDFPLLSDFWPHGGVASSYAVFNADVGVANRGTFLIDREGIVAFAEMNGLGQGRDPQRWRDAIASL